MRVAVLGYGVEGASAVGYWSDLGHSVEIRDSSEKLTPPDGAIATLGDDYLNNLDQFDIIVRSPGTKPAQIAAANPALDMSKVTSVTNEFFEQCPANIIGVTGTKGKGTTSSLIAAMLKEAGTKAHLGGNIGKPALDLLPDIQPSDWVILELSSFQLIDVTKSPHVGVMLMIAPDHMDWHPDMAEYRTAKQNIFKFQQPGDRAIYNACNIYSLEAGLGAPGDQIGYNATGGGAWCDGKAIRIGDHTICSVGDIALIGAHNRDNVCAAVTAVWPIIEDTDAIKRAIKDFKGLPHRLEPVGEVDGVAYINDSYSSNIGPTLAALQSLSAPKILIIGGYDKKLDYRGLATQIAESNVRQVIVIGAIAPQIVKDLDDAGVSNYKLGTGKMKEIVQLAASLAEPGDVVLLSPATSSFDMFDNFAQRGEQFREAVHNLNK